MNHALKDPDAILEYGFDLTDWLVDSDTIANASWTVPTGLTKGTETKTDTITTVVISGGTAGNEYKITDRITTTAGRVDDRSIMIVVAER